MIYVKDPYGKFRIDFDYNELEELEIIEEALIKRKTKEALEIAQDIRYGINQIKKEEDDLPF